MAGHPSPNDSFPKKTSLDFGPLTLLFSFPAHGSIAMSQKTRWVTLDGRYAGNYSTNWFLDSDEKAFLGTLYTANLNSFVKTPSDINMTFTFHGSEFILLGQSKVSSSSPNGVPRWRCTMDGTPAKLDLLGDKGRFSCSWKGQDNDRHTFLLAMESNVGSVSVDYVSFLPTFNSTRLENSYVTYNHDDPNVSIQSGNWTTLTHGGDNATLTDTEGSTLSFIFTGTEVIAEGWSPSGFPAGNSDATYSIANGRSNVPFKVEPPHPPSETIHGKELFQLSRLDPGVLHNLTITYKGPSTPLVIDRFYVKDGNFRVEPEPEAPRPSGTGATSSGDFGKTIGDVLKIAIPTAIGLFLIFFVVGCLRGCFPCLRRRAPKASIPVAQTDGPKDQPYPPPQDQQPIPLHPYYPPHNESGVRLMQEEQWGPPYPPAPPPPYPPPAVSQALQGLSVSGGGEANVAGRDNNNITIHNLTIHPNAYPLSP